MTNISVLGVGLMAWLCVLAALGPLLFCVIVAYNAFLHPLAGVPGPFWARTTGIPSWLRTFTGNRHIWVWQMHHIYGDRVRVGPNEVVFLDPEAWYNIYGNKANTRRAPFYHALVPPTAEPATLSTTDVAEHARKRKILNRVFTDKFVRTSSEYAIKHVDRWTDIIGDECDKANVDGWSKVFNFTEMIDALIFDIMGDLILGQSTDIKEPGSAHDNPLKTAPHAIANNIRFINRLCRAPFLDAILFMRPWGLDRIAAALSPPTLKENANFGQESLEVEETEKPAVKQREDFMYHLMEAKDSETGAPAVTKSELRCELNMMIVAAYDTTASTLASIFWYVTGDEARCRKLTSTIRATFEKAEDIVYGPELLGCNYLRACIDEGMRMAPVAPSELPREVLPGGIRIGGEHYAEGTIVGVSHWSTAFDERIWGDASTFRPERWIVDEAAGVTEEDVAHAKAHHHPFMSGPGSCVGKHVAMMEMTILIARTLHRLDMRRAPGSTLGGGGPEMGWGARNPKQFQVEDAFIFNRTGPEVQLRRALGSCH